MSGPGHPAPPRRIRRAVAYRGPGRRGRAGPVAVPPPLPGDHGDAPLQFQKQLRLQEARRLLLAKGLDAAVAGYRVGYASASHFSRDYKRMFGAPPRQDARRLREAASTRAVPVGGA